MHFGAYEEDSYWFSFSDGGYLQKTSVMSKFTWGLYCNSVYSSNYLSIYLMLKMTSWGIFQDQ
jgi:hypothetical protein